MTGRYSRTTNVIASRSPRHFVPRDDGQQSSNKMLRDAQRCLWMLKRPLASLSVLKHLLLLIVFFVLTNPCHAAWYNPGWSHRIKLRIQSSQVNGDQANFPVYVNLADLSNTNFFGTVRSDGADIRVTKSDGSSEVAREIVVVDTGSSTGEMHFVANGTLSGSTNTDFYIYYGNGDAANYDNGDTYGSDKVWANNYVGVWHMEEDPDGGASSILDSTLYNNHGSPQNMAGEDPVAGVLGKALDFDGSNEAVVVASTTDHNVTNLTISAWAKQDTQANYMEVAGRWGTGDNLFTMLTETGKGGPRFWVNVSGGSHVADDTTNYSTGVWRYYTGTYNGETVISYLDSNQVDSNTTPSGNLDTGTQQLQIGYRIDAGVYAFDGSIDEVRMASVARSTGWIDTEFNNQNGTTNFYTVGGEEVDCSSVSWYNPGWSRRSSITIQASQISGVHRNFPIYVDLSDFSNNFFTNLRSDGADIRVTKCDGTTEVAREIVAIDTANGTGEMYFVANGAISSLTDMDFYIYYGNGDAAEPVASSTYGSEKVWDSDYVGVWHMQEDPNGDTSDAIKDSTSFANHGTPNGTMLSADLVAGKLGKAIDLDGSDDFIDMGSTSLGITNALTVSFWANFNTLTASTYYTPFSFGGYTSDGFLLQRAGAGGHPLRFASEGSVVVDGAGLTTTGQWFNCAATLNSGTSYVIYLNANGTANTAGGTSIVDPKDLEIGRRADNTSQYADAKIDEVRISKIARSSNWIQTEYNNQNSPSTFYAIAGEELNCPTVSWYNAGWSNRSKLTVRASQVNGDLTNFPVYVDLSNFAFGDFFSTVNGTGADIRVTRCDGNTEVPREVVAVDTSNATGEMYFLAEGLLSASTDTNFYIYYGNGDASEPAASSTYGSEKVWDSNYVGVWHLGENGNTLDNGYQDSTANANHGNGVSMTSSSDLPGKFGKAQDFDGANDYIDFGSGPVLSGGNFTWSLWAKIDSAADFEVLLSESQINSSNNRPWSQIQLRPGSNELRVQQRFQPNATTRSAIATGFTDFTNGSWHHISATQTGGNGGTLSLYLDGVFKASDTTVLTDPHGNDTLRLSHYYASSTEYSNFDGLIDELRVSNIAHSSDWLVTEYNNQNTPNVFYSIEDDLANGWTASTKITIKASLVNDDLSDFPVHINLSHLPSTFFTTVNSSGADIRVTNGNQMTQMPYELVSIDTNNGSGELWFKADALSGSSNTDFYIHYGNASAKAPPAASLYGSQNVWTNGYRGVWHMQEDPNGDPSDAIKDSTSNLNHGTPSGSMTSADSVPGVTGNAIDFDGTNDYILLGLPPSLNIGKSTLTIDTWVYTPQLTTGGTDIIFNNETSYEFGVSAVSRVVEAAIDTVDPGGWSWGGSSTMSFSNWEKLTLVVDGTNWSFYKDGSHAETIAATGGETGTIVDGATDVRIGARSSGGHHWKGILEEVRVSDLVRSADWIKTEFNNLFKSEDFYLINDKSALDSSWSNKNKITVHAAQINGDLSNFPVYIDLSDMPGSFFTNVKPDGADIRVTNGNQMTQMPVEVVNLDIANGSGEMWFSANFLSSTANTNFWVFYNNSGASTAPASSNYGSYNVWSNGYLAVYHLGEDGNTNSNGYRDSTSNQYHGNGVSMTSSSDLNGQLGMAQDFDGSSDYIDLGTAPNAGSNYTVTAWINTDDISGNRAFFDNSDNEYYHRGASGGRQAAYSVAHGGFVASNTPLTINQWHYVGQSYSAGNVNFYLNGNNDGTQAFTASAWTANSKTIATRNGVDDYDGSIDEFHISNKARSANWINAEYNNQNSPKTFYKIGGGGLFDWQLF